MARLDDDVDEVREGIKAAQLAMQSIQFQMDGLAASVDQAGQDSRMALDLQKETLMAERTRLRLRLQQLDDQIASWEQSLPASARPETTRPSIVPEQPSQLTEKEPDTKPNGGETSIWDRRR